MTFSVPTIQLNRDTVTDIASTATAKIERFIKAHIPNLPTYAYVATVATLQSIIVVCYFLLEQIERLPEYRLMLRLKYVYTKRAVVRLAIAIEKFRINTIDRYETAVDTAIDRYESAVDSFNASFDVLIAQTAVITRYVDSVLSRVF